uniref:Uncharacterized protein n=1 Tax=Polytomella parva TaxID=51329 RepID=A0A7S0UXD3_9CHLO
MNPKEEEEDREKHQEQEEEDDEDALDMANHFSLALSPDPNLDPLVIASYNEFTTHESVVLGRRRACDGLLGARRMEEEGEGDDEEEEDEEEEQRHWEILKAKAWETHELRNRGVPRNAFFSRSKEASFGFYDEGLEAEDEDDALSEMREAREEQEEESQQVTEEDERSGQEEQESQEEEESEEEEVFVEGVEYEVERVASPSLSIFSS